MATNNKNNNGGEIKINLNTANAEQIAKTIPKINARMAKDIVTYRQENGPFKNWEDFKKISGFTTEIVNNLKEVGTLV